MIRPRIFILFSVISIIAVFSASAQQLYNFEVLERHFYGDSARGPITGVCCDGRYLYLTENYDSLKVFTLTEAGLLYQNIGTCRTGRCDNIFKYGNIIIGVTLSVGNGVDIFDVSNHSSPSLVSEVRGEGAEFENHARVYNGRLYIPFGNYFEGCGMKRVDISELGNPRVIDTVSCNNDHFYMEGLEDIDFKGNIGYCATSIIDISDSVSMSIIGDLNGEWSPSAKVYGNHLFHGRSVYDLGNPISPIFELDLISDLDVISTIDIVNGFLYRMGWNGDPWNAAVVEVWDVGGFEPPILMAYFSIPSTYNQSFPQFSANGRIFYYASVDSGLFVMNYTGPMPINTGDANNSGAVNGIDVIFLANYLKYGGNPPAPPRERGDTNGDCVVNGLDIVYLVNYLKGGPSPIRGFCYGQ